ncbi:hypothetical protein CLV51_105149 [Chitinophaga niastensis]|uniref:Uncharacterized protein n=1 Tax=Chitinophaga niastensis TaxID=536980 RepID=A0A2P8HEX0_CHINA|nr:hypothetical protein [Chitinophaga niastensis]PSL44777.1 hypothetical protein CLV51_105149 [Chitinophaga niastensis]
MRENSFHKGFINEKDSPIQIPPVGEGWADMDRRLQASLPSANQFRWAKYMKIAAVVAVTGGIAVALLTVQHTHTHQQAPATAQTTAADSASMARSYITWDTISKQQTVNDPVISGRHTPVWQPGVIAGTDTGTGAEAGTKTEIGIDTDTLQQQQTNHPTLKTTVTNASIAGITLPEKEEKTNAKDIPDNKHQKSSIIALNKSLKKSNAKYIAQTLQQQGENETYTPTTAAITTTGSTAQLLQSLPLAVPDSSKLLKARPDGALSITAGIRTHKDHIQHWQLMLQWAFPVPLAGNAYYFTGPNGNNQAYRMLLPGARIVRQWKNSSVSLDLVPFTSQTYNDHIYQEKTTTDTFGVVRKQIKALTKKFGWSTSLAYHHHISRQWQAAAGIQINYWQKANTYQQRVNKNPILSDPFFNGAKEFVKERSYNLDWQATGEVYYDAPRWQTGIRIGVPINTNRSDTVLTKIKSPVQVQLIFRYKLPHRRNK